MRGITGEQNAAMAIVGQGHRAGTVHGSPHGLPRQVPFTDGVEVPLNECRYGVGLKRVFGALVRTKLVVDAPDVVGLPMHQHRGTAMPLWVKPGASLGGMGARQLDVDDHIASFIRLAFQVQPQRFAHETLPAVACHEPRPLQLVVAIGVAYVQRNPLSILRECRHFGAPAEIDQARSNGIALLYLVEQELLDVVLRQVHHGRKGLSGIRGHLETKHLVSFVEAAADRPGQAFGQKARQRAEPLHKLQAATRDANGAAANANGVVSFQYDAANAVVRQAERQCHSDRPASHDEDGVPPRFDPLGQPRRLRRMANVAEAANRR